MTSIILMTPFCSRLTIQAQLKHPKFCGKRLDLLSTFHPGPIARKGSQTQANGGETSLFTFCTLAARNLTLFDAVDLGKERENKRILLKLRNNQEVSKKTFSHRGE